MRLVIVGGVAGGASAATRARRLDENAEIVLFERGEHVSFANCGLPYHVGGVIQDRNSLLIQTPAKLKARYNLDVRVNTEVTRIDRAAKQVHWRDMRTGQTGVQGYDKLVLSPGAVAVRPSFPGADLPRVLTLRNIADMDRIVAAIRETSARRAVVIGGGYIGLEVVENLARRGIRVTLVEALNQVMAAIDWEMATPLHQHLRYHGVDLRLGRQVASVSQQPSGLCVQLQGGEQVEADLAVLCVGVRPDTTLAREAGLDIGVQGGIGTHNNLCTRDPDIYAVGDAIEQFHVVTGQRVCMPLAGPANRQGRIAAGNALGRNVLYRGGQGTAIVQVFDLAVAMTGLNEKQVLSQNMSYDKCYVHPTDHASYYPQAFPMVLKLLFSKPQGRILGACAVGVKGVDKRIDVIATALRAGLTVFDLEHLELCYSPQYGSAKDPVNYAGFVASNALRGDVKVVHVEELDRLDPKAVVILDVRTREEHDRGHIPGSIHVPVDELRQRLQELPRDRRIVAYCQVGLRGYVAARLLTQKGFDVSNLSGGFRTYCQHHDHACPGCAKALLTPAAPPACGAPEKA